MHKNRKAEISRSIIQDALREELTKTNFTNEVRSSQLAYISEAFGSWQALLYRLRHFHV